MEITQYNNMDLVRDTAKYHYELLASIFQFMVIKDHEVKGKSKGKFYDWTA